MSLPIVYSKAKAELEQILDAGARFLKPAGHALLPIKRSMLIMTDAEANLILDACNLLFAAILAYEDAQWSVKHAPHPVAMVAARIEAGRAEAVVHSLFHGPTAPLLVTAMNHAPIAFYAMAAGSPDLQIIGRCQQFLNATAHNTGEI